MLISGAAAGMSAVFRAPLTGIVFALEMPYKDDLAHEALLPIADRVGGRIRDAGFDSGGGAAVRFRGQHQLQGKRRLVVGLLGAGIGLIAIVFDITFRRVRRFSITSTLPHWLKLTIGGLAPGSVGSRS